MRSSAHPQYPWIGAGAEKPADHTTTSEIIRKALLRFLHVGWNHDALVEFVLRPAGSRLCRGAWEL